MMVLHGVCTGEDHRSGNKLNEDTGELRPWKMDFYKVFDGVNTSECQLADDFGPLKPGDVVTAQVELRVFRNQVQIRLVRRVDAAVASAFTPEIAQMVLATTGQVAGAADSGRRAA